MHSTGVTRMWGFTMREFAPLARMNAWRIGGSARYLTTPSGTDDLRAALAFARDRDLPVLLLGGGTNVLLRDHGWPGLVIRYRDTTLTVTEHSSGALALIGTGAPMAGTARRLAHQGWAGLEWAEGLPGTIGGAVVGNAGCYGGDTAAAVDRVWLLIGEEVVERSSTEIGYGYRTSTLKTALPKPERFVEPPLIVVAAAFRLLRADPATLDTRMAETAAQRKLKTPWGASCGSVFKNPPGDSAGRLIEAAGLKGAESGPAQIAAQHANYIINRGGASSDDVLHLIDLARTTVLREFGITLDLEVRIVG